MNKEGVVMTQQKIKGYELFIMSTLEIYEFEPGMSAYQWKKICKFLQFMDLDPLMNMETLKKFCSKWGIEVQLMV